MFVCRHYFRAVSGLQSAEGSTLSPQSLNSSAAHVLHPDRLAAVQQVSKADRWEKQVYGRETY